MQTIPTEATAPHNDKPVTAKINKYVELKFNYYTKDFYSKTI